MPALHVQCLAHNRGVDIGIAVPVPADPAADAQKGRHGFRERVFQTGVQAGQFAEERMVVIGQAVRDFVYHFQPFLPQHIGLPQGQDRAAKPGFEFRPFFRREAAAFARIEQGGDIHFAVHRALAANLRGVRGQYGIYRRAREKVPHGLRRHTGFVRLGQGKCHRPAPRGIAGQVMASRPPDVMIILGYVCQMGEVAERANDLHGLIRGQRPQQRLKVASGIVVVVAVKADRRLPDRLDKLEDTLAFLGADRLPQDTAEKADILAQRNILFLGTGIVGNDLVRIGRHCVLPPRRNSAERTDDVRIRN